MPRGIPYTANECDRRTLAVGITFELSVHEIAVRMKVPERTLRRHYPDVFREAELKVGRPTYQPAPEEREFVRCAASQGVPHTNIAQLIGCSKATLRKYFAQELRLGKAQANISVGAQLYRIATGDPSLASTLTAAIFWAKCHMGWRGSGRADASLGPISGAASSGHVVVVGPQDAEPP